MAISSGYMRKRFKLMGIPKNIDGTPERDEIGQLTTERKLIASPWCSIKVVSSAINIGSSAKTHQLTLEFTVRWTKTLANPTPDMEIVFDDKNYDIISVVNPSFKKEKLLVTAIKRN
jgi:SPP1 family predicted phage head-tail adaptor